MSTKTPSKSSRNTRSMTRTKNEVPTGSGLSTEQSIVNDTYNTDKQTDKPSNKKARVTLHQDEDTNFNSYSSGTETVLPTNNIQTSNIINTPNNKEYNLQLPPEPTLASIFQDMQSLHALIHNPHMIVDHLENAPITNQYINRTTSPESQNQQTTSSMETTQTLQIEHISLDDQKQNPLNIFYSFLIKEEFGKKSNSQISEIITEICGSLPGFLKIENYKEKFNHVELVKISFINETSRNSLSNVTNKRYNITFHNYDKTSLDTQTNNFNKHKEERTIKVVEVPRSFSVKNIKDIFTTQIYITPVDTPTCTVCEHFEHDYTNCTNKDKIETFLHNPKEAKITPDNNIKSSAPYLSKRGRNFLFNNDQQINKSNKNVSYNQEYEKVNTRRQRSRSRSRKNFTNDPYHYEKNNTDNTNYSNKIIQIENNLAHLTSRVNEIKLTQQQYEQALTSINKQYKEVMDKIQDIQNTLESINHIDQTQNTILQMVKEIKNSQKKSFDEHDPNTPKPRTRPYYTNPPINRNQSVQHSDFNSDNQEYLVQQSKTSSQQDYFPPHDDETDDIEIHTVTANSETTGQPAFNISSLIPTNWGVYPRSGQ
ncbi:hypothetical protein RclHR1_04300013 [Rhizophagus clarus]|uniref:Uncharacterized protein n=1 Tax=Rhizophagus clarus TaxID=94130 RepID=A0A2Z6RI54_9GLOM|nr:hypothetical protein RclHR1_04300013 [Rhizophagus clarus]GES72707.1 hypothetical protein RCL_jg15374.t1 [Rhizophagus clarus]